MRLKLLFSLLVVAVVTSSAYADELDCLVGLKGKVVRWDQAWQEDMQDQNVLYRVQSVIDGQTRPREITLFLSTDSPATRKIRKAVVTRPIAAQLICSRASGGPQKLSQIPPVGALSYPYRARRTANPKAQKSKEVTSDQLSFRTLIAGNWVAAHPAPNSEQFVCLVKNTAYACGERDYKFVQSVQNESGMQPRTIHTVDSSKPFIRNFGEGWRLASGVDLQGSPAIAECNIGKASFSCLASEREKYKPQLTELAVEEAKARRWEQR